MVEGWWKRIWIFIRVGFLRGCGDAWLCACLVGCGLVGFLMGGLVG